MESTEPPPSEGLFLLFSPFVLLQVDLTGVLLGMVLLILLLICSALISGSEVAYFSLNPEDIHALSQEKHPSAQRILKLKEQPRILLATILIGNNFVNIAIIILSDYLIRHLFSMQAFEHWAAQIKEIPFLSGFELASLAVTIEFLLTVVAATFLLLRVILLTYG